MQANCFANFAKPISKANRELIYRHHTNSVHVVQAITLSNYTNLPR